MKELSSAPASVAGAVPADAMVEALPGHAAVLDADGVIVAVNEGWRRFARDNGYRGENFGIGTSYLAACGADSPRPSRFARRAVRVVSAVLSGDLECGSFDYPCHAPDAKRWFRMAVMPVAVAGARGAVVLHFDVTEECEQRTAHERALLKMRLAGGADRDLAGIIHDVKAPLNAIAGTIDFLRHDHAGPTTAKQRDYFDHILRACEDASRLIDHEIACLFADEAPVDTIVDVAHTLRALVDLFAAEAAQAGMRLEAVIPPGLPGLAVPSTVVTRIVGNLITNAIRYAGAGARIDVSAEVEAGELTVIVRDDGVGVPAEMLEVLLRPRRRGADARVSGVGLGLSVVHNLAAGHGAVFTARSSQGRGLEVAVTFGADAVVPIATLSAASTRARRPRKRARRSPANDKARSACAAGR